MQKESLASRIALKRCCQTTCRVQRNGRECNAMRKLESPLRSPWSPNKGDDLTYLGAHDRNGPPLKIWKWESYWQRPPRMRTPREIGSAFRAAGSQWVRQTSGTVHGEPDNDKVHKRTVSSRYGPARSEYAYTNGRSPLAGTILHGPIKQEVAHYD